MVKISLTTNIQDGYRYSSECDDIHSAIVEHNGRRLALYDSHLSGGGDLQIRPLDPAKDEEPGVKTNPTKGGVRITEERAQGVIVCADDIVLLRVSENHEVWLEDFLKPYEGLKVRLTVEVVDEG